MQWFGTWSGPYCEPEAKVATPVGALCGWCSERIAEGDNGVLMLPAIPGTGLPQAYHRECFRRAMLGSIAHLERRCSCSVPGATETDPPGISKREAARLVERWVEHNRHWKAGSQ